MKTLIKIENQNGKTTVTIYPVFWLALAAPAVVVASVFVAGLILWL